MLLRVFGVGDLFDGSVPPSFGPTASGGRGLELVESALIDPADGDSSPEAGGVGHGAGEPVAVLSSGALGEGFPAVGTPGEAGYVDARDELHGAKYRGGVGWRMGTAGRPGLGLGENLRSSGQKTERGWVR